MGDVNRGDANGGDVNTLPAAGRWALLSVSDKAGIVAFARQLAAAGLGLLSTGGTARALRDAGLAVTQVSALTGFPEVMDGRVKTLHPHVHGPILARRDVPSHMAAVDEHGLALIDVVVVNLYPFRETVAAGADPATVIENIDIGGPAMVRAAAKNHDHVLIVTSPDDYAAAGEAITAHGVQGVPSAVRRRLAGRAFRHVAGYDAAVADWFANGPFEVAEAGRALNSSELRYGENPHQTAQVIVDDAT
ncbi:MAG: bifunctional phosphoribosylaminoimidazolecarboxamide formyltransferase/IMP cyclohydrolase, partial [Pseudomonadota bacterium]